MDTEVIWQAGAEIKVTPHMRGAGIKVLLEYDDGWDSPQEIVAEIYHVMESERRLNLDHTSPA